MVLNMYSVRDRKAMEFSDPFVAKNDAVAQRFIVSSFIRSTEGIDPDDFELYRVGAWSNETGKITPGDYPEQIPIMWPQAPIEADPHKGE